MKLNELFPTPAEAQKYGLDVPQFEVLPAWAIEGLKDSQKGNSIKTTSTDELFELLGI
jgi:hypothetical protein